MRKGKARKGSGIHEITVHSREGSEGDIEGVKQPVVYPGGCIEMRRKQRMMAFEEDRNGFVF